MPKVLFIACHPDDETLGCGGTILKHKALGDEIYWAILTNIDENNGWPKDKVLSRQCEISAVARAYGFKKVFKLDFPTTKLDAIPMNTIVSAISNTLNEIKPEVIYVPNKSDIHSDHKTTFDAVMSCTKTFRFPYIKRVLMYECLSETEFAPAISNLAFTPNVFVNISAYVSEKIKIMNMYEGEMGAFPFPRSAENIEALARYRGATAGFCGAEAFVLIKERCDD
ncbi:MAG TPA: PIG-L family deacetylase [Candidatus Omnitrophota bacterium]|nr:PIG-L family deacetylase [Candidatus Omnitrophota bacterium]HPS19514.1 PIG-L family deacetylase [Candidatus Omnitrophota bacterium]